MSASFDVAIVGAGPAGCAAGIELARAGARVLLLEKSEFPRHKVCGEFLSPEVAAVLEELGCVALLDPAARLECGHVFTGSGFELRFPFPKPAYGLSRRMLDDGLARFACTLGVALEQKTEVSSVENNIVVSRDGRRFAARAVLLACGRHSLLNPAPSGRRAFFGFKAHFRGPWPARLDLHFFPGGYLGVMPIEDGGINACALVEKHLLKDHDSLFRKVLGREIQMDGEVLFTGPLEPGWSKGCKAGSPGILAAGDAAVFVDPFTGDGISLALRSGQMAARHTLALLEGADPRRVAVRYNKDLHQLCGRQMAASRVLRFGAVLPFLEAPVARLLAASPKLRNVVFRITRGSLAPFPRSGRQ